ncbi:uncharacterized protein Z519_03743 [Cladophialophora bantiana CBS 173.52]|uniref:Enoyl-CoA hydratase n=1 Tax=Cladophialophora bantiana (strain ATCC 10958 / CBS 173.52 / CDC B-1940 / NIH 8579) TaxID=1442370 RepID=A0A0D2IEE7_CLAB1|nr:uncharacterized protein Z519_03743 [Cladophialophora bantiana CBS 173.52]KIW95159.1 hypothetical protein Z519_03743 [Cladophialophora bantiana CBS 173.52]
MATLSPDPEQIVTLRTSGRVAIITLNNPQKLNAMRQQDTFRLSCLLRQVAAMPEITITIITGKGRFFCAGGDVTSRRPGMDDDHRKKTHEIREQTLRSFVANTFDATQSFCAHPKILVVGLNGPVVGLHAGLVGFADFVYAAPHAYLLAPFTSLGLVTEGGASVGLVQRLGFPLANEALLTSRRVPCEKLLQCGFVNKVCRGKNDSDSDGFLEQVLREVNEKFGDHLNRESVLRIKSLVQRPVLDRIEAQAVREVADGMQRFVDGAPQVEFKRVAEGRKRHKL